MKANCWGHLEGSLQGISRGEKIIIGGEIHDHMGREVNGHRDAYRGYCFGKITNKGKDMLDFVTRFIATRFKKWGEHLVTHKN